MADLAGRLLLLSPHLTEWNAGIMKSSRVYGFAIVGIAAMMMSFAATPAFAVATPTPGALTAGSSLFALDCDAGPIGQLYSLDVSTASATPIGTGSDIDSSHCAFGAAWDYATNTMYYAAIIPGASHLAYLASIDLTTGVSTAVGLLQAGSINKRVTAIAIGVNGNAYAIDKPGELYSLNLASGALTAIAATGSIGNNGFAADPTSGTYYVLNYITSIYSTINVSTGALTAVGTLSLTPSTGPEALQIDTNGTFWIENDGVNADIWSFDPANPSAAVEAGVVHVQETNVYVQTLLLRPGAVAPVITSSAPAASIPASVAFSYHVTATGTGPITFSITAGVLPPGLSLNPATGIISGTPTTPGSYAYTVIATNLVGTSPLSITQVVAPAAAPVIHLPVVSG